MTGDGAVSVPRSAAETITKALRGYQHPRFPFEVGEGAALVLAALAAAGFAVVQLPKPGEFSYDSDDVWMNDAGDIVDAVGDCYGPPADAAAFAVALLAAAAEASDV